MSSTEKLVQIVEASLLAAGSPLTLDNLQELFLEEERPDKPALRDALKSLSEDYSGRGIEVAEVGGGFRINVRQEFAPWVSRLWDERPARYSRALLETLALIAYRQPITRGEIEEIRGVSVSSHIVKTLLEREWVRVVGQRDVPGRPSLYATTREFLSYFGLKSLGELPTLQDIRDLDSINRELALEDPGTAAEAKGEDASPAGEVDEIGEALDMGPVGLADEPEQTNAQNELLSVITKTLVEEETAVQVTAEQDDAMDIETAANAITDDDPPIALDEESEESHETTAHSELNNER